MGPWNLIERRLQRFVRESLSVRNAAIVIIIATAVIVVGAGFVITLIDGEEYPNVASDVGAAVMLEGTAFIAIVTAVITSSFVARDA